MIAEMMKNDNDGSGDYGNDGDKKNLRAMYLLSNKAGSGFELCFLYFPISTATSFILTSPHSYTI